MPKGLSRCGPVSPSNTARPSPTSTNQKLSVCAIGGPGSSTSQKTLGRDAGAGIAACAGWASRLAARRITNFLGERMRGAELSIAQFGLMAQIAAAPDDTLGALALRTGLDQSTLSRNLRGLEAAGLVEIAIAENDLRRRAVGLTG